MSGIYIHIPFCKKACHYCNFHFSTTLTNKKKIIAAIVAEIKMRSDYLPTKNIESIYFGGGTPSILLTNELDNIFNEIEKHFNISSDAEVTLEANPDDLSKEKLHALKTTPVNRLSIGVQSFIDNDLRWMNRAHNANEAIASIQNAQEIGFDNLSIDLIYGTPNLSNLDWQKNIETAINLGVNHISSYCLTVEPKTPLAIFINKGKVANVNEEQALQQFNILIHTLETNAYEQYEISNFAKNKKYALHNTNYWMNKAYLGIGPSAHSFNKISRSWNVSNNIIYANAINNNELAQELETLSLTNKINEYIMTSLRTKWGCSLLYIEENFGYQYVQQILQSAKKHIANEQIILHENYLYISKKSKFFSDGISSDLFLL